MFKKLLLRSLFKHFDKLSPNEKTKVRDLVNETKSETTEKQKVDKRRKKKMTDEKDVKKEVEPEKEETDKFLQDVFLYAAANP